MAPRLVNLLHPLNRMLGRIESSPGLLGSVNPGYCTVGCESNGEEAIEDVKESEQTLRRESQPQGVDPKKGWGFRGVHKAIICGKVGQTPVQKILRNGRTVTIFTVGTAGMFDQRTAGMDKSTRPIQWHRIAVHNEPLGAYVVQQLIKDASVYVEGDIETRVYNDNINGTVKHVPEICVRRDGKVHLINNASGPVSEITLEGLRDSLF
jgi:single stranded DNA-binding protein|uniref:Single-stranded DNA-binding protein, mitochondrial n=1 Tax=Picea sitchensis TaxID=3332 RepID=A9NS43_PICSI|nr:unknown [Picea sitchensis]ACN40799.1 unknown [Picea sitchensis]